MLPVKISGLGYYLPEHIVTSAELERQLAISPGWIERTTGVHERRYVRNETTAGMAAAAAQRALDHAGMSVNDLDVIIGASTAMQQGIPCTAALVQRELGAPDGGSACFDINATCVSFIVALQAGAAMLAGGVYRTALIFSSEIASYSRNPKEHESAALFGDAAAAAIVTRAAPNDTGVVWRAQFNTYSSGADLAQITGFGTLHHPNAPSTTPEMNMFHMEGSAIFKKALRLFGPFLDEFLRSIGWERGEIDMVVPHQASRHGLEYLTARLGFRPEQVFINLPKRGNCIAASIPLALTEAVQAGAIQRGHRVLLLGTGTGLTLGALALTF